VVKKDRQQNCYTLAYPKKYVTNILPDSLTKTTDASPVYFIHNLVEPDTIRKTSEVRETGSSISLPNYYRKSPSQITKISRFTSINDHTNLVAINHLLANNLLPYRTKVIDCDRPHSVGMYQSVHARINLAEEGYPIKKSVYYPN
jgi:hypothetical protein